jgi:two-component system phosphate regulon sensor histidine kinase PhoR
MKRLAWRITAAYVALILAITLGLGLYLPATLRQAQFDQLRTHLAEEARLVADAAAPLLAAGDRAAIQALARRLGAAAHSRVTIIAPDGVVVGESEADPAILENHSNRPEIAAVLRGGDAGASERHSASVDRDLLYVAVPIEWQGRTIGVARVARDRTGIEMEFWRAIGAVLVALAIAGTIAVVLAGAIATRISRPITRLTEAAGALARGELRRPTGVWGGDEIGALGQAFDDMAARLRETIDTLSSDRARLSAVLTAMADGLILIDRDEEVILANAAASDLLEFPPDRLTGGPLRLIELVHDHELHDLAQRTIASGRQGELTKFAASGRHLRITGAPMKGGGAAALLLVQDVTEIRRAELIRREFVANVSHELKTPIASIKALTETLEGGAIEDLPVAMDFLQRMHVEVDGLAQLVQELLDLSRLESGRARMRFERTPVPELLQAATGRLLAQADRAGLTLSVDAPAELPQVRADASRIEGALINLVHNAIKFTPPGGSIRVRATLESPARPAEVRIEVIDTGVGIPTDALDRLFERFYKADKSRATSGTGLGLAIVKHVVQAHGGRVGVESKLGEGSTFWFTLPVA